MTALSGAKMENSLKAPVPFDHCRITSSSHKEPRPVTNLINDNKDAYWQYLQSFHPTPVLINFT